MSGRGYGQIAALIDRAYVDGAVRMLVGVSDGHTIPGSDDVLRELIARAGRDAVVGALQHHGAAALADEVAAGALG